LLLSLSLNSFAQTHHTLYTFCSHSWCPFIGNNGATSSYSSLTKVAANSSSSSTMVATNSQWLVLSIFCTCNGNNPILPPPPKRKNHVANINSTHKKERDRKSSDDQHAKLMTTESH